MIFIIICKKKNLNNKIKNIIYIINPLESLILINLIFYTKVIYYYTIKYIIYNKIIANKNINIFHDFVIFEDKAKSFPLI